MQTCIRSMIEDWSSARPMKESNNSSLLLSVHDRLLATENNHETAFCLLLFPVTSMLCFIFKHCELFFQRNFNCSSSLYYRRQSLSQRSKSNKTKLDDTEQRIHVVQFRLSLQSITKAYVEKSVLPWSVVFRDRCTKIRRWKN